MRTTLHLCVGGGWRAAADETRTTVAGRGVRPARRKPPRGRTGRKPVPVRRLVFRFPRRHERRCCIAGHGRVQGVSLPNASVVAGSASPGRSRRRWHLRSGPGGQGISRRRNAGARRRQRSRVRMHRACRWSGGCAMRSVATVRTNRCGRHAIGMDYGIVPASKPLAKMRSRIEPVSTAPMSQGVARPAPAGSGRGMPR